MGNPFLLVAEGASLRAVDDDFTVDPSVTSPANLPPDQPGPNRVTAYVPSEETTLNLGTAWPGPHPPSLAAGITGRTAHHVHMHTMGADDGVYDPTRTILRLGIPTKGTILDANAKSQDLEDLEQQIADLDARITQEDVAYGIGNVAMATGIPVAGAIGAGYTEWEHRVIRDRLMNDRERLEERRRNMEAERLQGLESRTGVPSVAPFAHDPWCGYSLVTRGGSIHESAGNCIIVSAGIPERPALIEPEVKDSAPANARVVKQGLPKCGGDVRIAGERSVAIGSGGDVLIAVNKGTPASEYCENRDQGQMNDPYAAGPGKIHRDVSDWITNVNTVAVAATGAWFTTMGFVQGYNRKARLFETGWAAPGAGDYFGTLLAELMAPMGPMMIALGPIMDTPGGRLDLYSSSGVSVTGAMTAKLHGCISASVASEAMTSITGGQVLTLSSNGKASFTGSLVDMSGVAKVGIQSLVGPLTMRSRSSMELTTHRDMLLCATRNTQINANDGELLMFGRSGFYVGCGGGGPQGPGGAAAPTRFSDVSYDNSTDGYGLHGTADHVAIGCVESPHKYSSQRGENTNELRITNDKAELKHGTGKLEMTSDHVKLQHGSSITMDDTGLTFNSTRVNFA